MQELWRCATVTDLGLSVMEDSGTLERQWLCASSWATILALVSHGYFIYCIYLCLYNCQVCVVHVVHPIRLVLYIHVYTLTAIIE